MRNRPRSSGRPNPDHIFCQGGPAPLTPLRHDELCETHHQDQPAEAMRQLLGLSLTLQLRTPGTLQEPRQDWPRPGYLYSHTAMRQLPRAARGRLSTVPGPTQEGERSIPQPQQVREEPCPCHGQTPLQTIYNKTGIPTAESVHERRIRISDSERHQLPVQPEHTDVKRRKHTGAYDAKCCTTT